MKRKRRLDLCIREGSLVDIPGYGRYMLNRKGHGHISVKRGWEALWFVSLHSNAAFGMDALEVVSQRWLQAIDATEADEFEDTLHKSQVIDKQKDKEAVWQEQLEYDSKIDRLRKAMDFYHEHGVLPAGYKFNDKGQGWHSMEEDEEDFKELSKSSADSQAKECRVENGKIVAGSPLKSEVTITVSKPNAVTVPACSSTPNFFNGTDKVFSVKQVIKELRKEAKMKKTIYKDDDLTVEI